MLVTEHIQSDTLIVNISGRFDQNNDIALENALLRGLEKKVLHVVLNLEQVSSIDTAGIGRMFLTFFRLKQQGICLSVVKPRPAVMEILRLVEIPKMVRIFPSNEAAFAWQATSPQFPSLSSKAFPTQEVDTTSEFHHPPDGLSRHHPEANA